MRRRREVLRTTILSNQQFLTVNSLLSQKQNIEHFRSIATKITKLSDKKKDFVTNCFIAMAKYDYRVRFLEWYQNFKLDPCAKGSKRKEHELSVSIEECELMKQKLTEFIAGVNIP